MKRTIFPSTSYWNTQIIHFKTCNWSTIKRYAILSEIAIWHKWFPIAFSRFAKIFSLGCLLNKMPRVHISLLENFGTRGKLIYHPHLLRVDSSSLQTYPVYGNSVLLSFRLPLNFHMRIIFHSRSHIRRRERYSLAFTNFKRL